MASPAPGDDCQANESTWSENSDMRDALKGRKSSWSKLRHSDSLNLEAGRVSSMHSHEKKVDWHTTLRLAFQSIGVVYGDIGTSPLYVYSSTFPDGVKDRDDLLGALSLILYTLILLPLIKYVFIVLRANDNGDGGTFALYSLISRHAKVSWIPNQQAEDAMLSHYKLEIPSTRVKRAYWIKEKLEKSEGAKTLLFFITILGTSMVIGDGVLTPCISVLSAVDGITQKAESLTEGTIAGISIAILILLFLVQRFGTDKVGYSFAPVVTLWCFLIGGIGLYNLCRYEPAVLKAFNPKYIVDYFKRNGKEGWISLGGIVLCITGTEAMFADLGHFNMKAIQVAFSFILLPSISLAYIGQASYLHKHPDDVYQAFYKSIPNPLYWPTFIIAVAASIIASQAMISGAFAIISQSQTLGCFPRVKIIHTSAKYEGQVYIPEINYALMAACVIVTAIFRTTVKIGNAYGIAVVCVMVITTIMVSLIMFLIWKISIWWILLFLVGFGAIELVYFSSVLYKFTEGGYLPLGLAFILMIIMAVWHYVRAERYQYELKNKVSSSYIKDLAQNRDLNRIPGIGLLYSELVQGIPPIFPLFIKKIPSVHAVLIFVSIKFLPIGRIEMEERFLFRMVEPKELRMFRCVVRYGYKDALEEPKEFQSLLIEKLKVFIHNEFLSESMQAEQPASNTLDLARDSSSRQEMREGKSQRSSASTVHVEEGPEDQLIVGTASSDNIQPRVNGTLVSGPIHGAEDEIKFIEKEMEKGLVYLLGETEVVAAQGSSVFKKILVDYFYTFMRKNFRQGERVVAIPQSELLKVGMVYAI